MRNVQEVWMRLEALAHLRGLPSLKNLRQKLEAELAEMDADLAPKDEGPKAIPAPVVKPEVKEEEHVDTAEEPTERRL